MDRLKPLFYLIAALILPAMVMLPGCNPVVEETPTSGERLTIVTTVNMVGDIVRNVVGDHAAVHNIIGEGVDPHLYQPTRSDIQQLMDADVIFYVGLHLEGRMIDALEQIGKDGRVFAVTNLIDEQYLLHPPDFEGSPDPHVWMDVNAWSKTVDAVKDSMSEIQPQKASDYAANAAAYQEQLSALDAYVKRVVSSVPESQRVLITAHDAFNYFGRAYDLEVRGIQGISTESEAGLADVNALVDLLVENRIGAVFVETSVADRNVRALIDGAKAQDHEVIIGGSLFSDAMGEPGTYEGTYIGMIDHNATTIARALGGEAPEKGLNDKLTGGSE